MVIIADGAGADDGQANTLCCAMVSRFARERAVTGEESARVRLSPASDKEGREKIKQRANESLEG